MNLSPDSPELTAYALGQLDSTRAARVADQVAHSAELQAEVDAIRATALLLEQEFAAEPSVSLSPDRRTEIVSQAAADRQGASVLPPPSEPPTPRRPTGTHWWTALLEQRNAWGLGLAAAAALTLAYVFHPASTGPRPVVESDRTALAPHTPPSDAEVPTPSALPASPSAPPVVSRTEAAATTPLPSEAKETPLAAAKKPSPSPAPTEPAKVPARATTLSLATAPDSIQPLSEVTREVLDPPVTSTAASKYGLRGGTAGGADLRRSKASVARDNYSTLDALGSTAPAGGVSAATRGLESLAKESRTFGRAESGPSPALAPKDRSTSDDTEWRRRYRLPRPTPATEPPTAEAYEPISENPFKDTTQSPLSTFGIDADTAAYSNLRRFLREGQLPPRDAVRIEEMLNYFPYSYASPKAGKHPFATHIEVTECPWNPEHRLVRVAVKAREIPRGERPHANLVFLIDVSGSMAPENKLPLVKRALRLLVERLDGADNVGIVTYAGRAEIALEPTSCDNKERIVAAIDKLEAGSGTNGGEGIQGAYRMARGRFEKSAVNRVILCTDGDFNIGITGRDELNELIVREAKTGVYLSVLGFGMGNLKDATMEMLADKGNGHYAYIDSFTEARKVLSEQLEGTLVTVAKDVKIQVEFNPLQVASWRQIGYENRNLAARDFNDDTKDAGEVGAGHSVTALYEIIPTGAQLAANGGPLRYQPKPAPATQRDTLEHAGELLHFKLRYKQPDSESSVLMEEPVMDSDSAFSKATTDCKWSAAVAAFGMLLRESPHKGNATYDSVLRLAEQGLGRDDQGYRSEFIDLVRQARTLRQR